MLFNSFSFMAFFPVVVVLDFAIPKKWRYLWLLAASYFFYMCWNVKYVLLLAGSTAITYAGALMVERAATAAAKKGWVAAVVLTNLGILGFFKYFNFFSDQLEVLFSRLGWQLNMPQFDILLPVGISFYIFQALGYTIDVYRGEVQAIHHPLKYALFVSFFPQLVAGPIERSKNLIPQLMQEPKDFDYDRVKNGLILMMWGFFEKLVIADRIAVLVGATFDYTWTTPGAILLVAAVLFAFNIYCDFAGYSHIAIGAAQVLGVQLMENFRQPYFAVSVKDFWHRWHISLSTWFRDYLYIPLGGSRKGRLRTFLNVLITFSLSGLWHGANWTYLVWGFLNGLFQVIETITTPLRKKISDFFPSIGKSLLCRILRSLITFVLIDFTWVFFRVQTVHTAYEVSLQMVGRLNDFGSLSPSYVYQWCVQNNLLSLMDWLALGGALLLLFLVDLAHENGILLRDVLQRQNILVRWAFYLGMVFLLLLFGMQGSGYTQQAFIYFQF